MPELRLRETRLKAELEAQVAQLADQATYLRLAHTLREFLDRLHRQAQNLGVMEQQPILRLLVKEVIVGQDSITIRHSIPNVSRPSGGFTGPADPSPQFPEKAESDKSSLLRTWREWPALRRAFAALLHDTSIHDAAVEVRPNQPDHSAIIDASLQSLYQDVVVDPVKEFLQINVHHNLAPRLYIRFGGFHRVLRASARSKAVAVFAQCRVNQGLQHL